MHTILVNPPKIFALNAAGRVVQIAGVPGEIGRFDNMVVPDAREIRRLRPAVTFLGKLKPTPFNYRALDNYRSHREPVAPTATPVPFNRLDNLPLFQKL